MEEVKLLKENIHMHSNYSWDANITIEDIVDKLLEKEISIAALTDHVEFDREDVKEVINKFKIRNIKIDNINKKYKGRLKLLKGIEVTRPNIYPEKFKELSKLDFDIIMGSVHKVPYANNGLEEKNYTYQYYEQIFEMIEFGGIDVVGHLDYINRYFKHDYADYAQLGKIFAALKHSGIVLEVNASAARRNKIDNKVRACKDQLCFPDIEKLRLYREYCKQVTIGTDSHQLNEIDDNLTNTQYLVNQLGLQTIYFEKRKKKVLNPLT